MSITTTLNNALSGLSAVSRLAQNVSSNVSNAMTDGYAPREVLLSQQVLAGHGAGVKVAGVQRLIDPVLLANRRLAEADLAMVTTQFEFLEAVEQRIGMPDDPTSLSGRTARFGAALIEASSRPDSEARLQAVLEAAKSVTGHLNTVSDHVQQSRMGADQAIAKSVEFLNTSLQQVAKLNAQILQVTGVGRSSSALIDQRQNLIDGIAEQIPVREISRDNGTIALYSPGGASLIDGVVAELGFSSVGTIIADMTLDSGALSGLTINGHLVATDAGAGPIAGGRLAGLFDVRDVQAPAVQTRLDAVARDLIERFQDPAVDPTLAVGDPGLFTDAGAALVIADETGLAGRIAVNALVDPDAGGALWRLRDGIGAAASGSSGDATLLNALSDTLTEARLPATGDFISPHSATGVASDFLSGISVSLTAKETHTSFARAHSETLIGLELQNGVDTDAEMQKLLLVEQIFAANARVIATADELIQSLLRL
ncbi:MAG: flagellar hook-associated protein FlgK [Rhodobacteraceae bacterium]|nr:flagellar hook-associated protein FlgK [Paracoccaceae bacterium]